jgi:LmbE family N-acetylglucosaminyl deacetylase
MVDHLRQLLTGDRPELRVTLVAAHPDDEVIGAGARLRCLPGLRIVHVTDGAPRDLYDAQRYGFSDAESYARQRRRELDAALLAGNVQANLVELGFADQSAVANLFPLALKLAEELSAHPPDLILTHPYEGGHPDHDATAAAVSAAIRIAQCSRTEVAEFASYNGRGGQFRPSEFLHNGPPEIVFELSVEERERKQRMIDCFTTQHETLAQFRVDRERFRLAPTYDFTRPPHSGMLWYERFDWGTRPDQFRAAAARLIADLELAA